jgi:hypothetical protein
VPTKPSRTGSQRRTISTRRAPEWARWSDEQLLDLRICDLGLRIEGTKLERWIEVVARELEGRGMRFRPHYWLSDEWFTPDGVPGIAIPFYLAHPRLARLELAQMLEIEGGKPAWGMRILRHEVGHAIDNAYRLQLRRRRQQLFGKWSAPYPEYYIPRPYSKSYVMHLDAWYAQSHPAEDFAETFAVWLTPHSDWKRRYAGWGALKKLEYMDELMGLIAGRKPLVTSRRVVDPLHTIKRTLRQHYARKRKHYGVDHPAFYDRDLRRLFSDAPEHATYPAASKFLHRIRVDVRRRVARWTSTYQYTIDQVFEDVIARCDTLNLRLAISEERAKLDFTVFLTVQTMNFIHGGGHRVAL